MVHFYVEDQLANSSKARRAGNSAMGLWVMCGSYSGHQLSEGLVPDWYVNGFKSSAKDVAALINVGLFHTAGATCESGDCPANRAPVPAEHYAFHDWYATNTRTKAVVEQERAANRQRKRAYDERQRNGGSNASSNAVTNAEVTSLGKAKQSKDLTTTHIRSSSPISAPTDDGSYSQVGKGVDNLPAGSYPETLAAAAKRLSEIAREPVSVAQAGIVVDMILGRNSNIRRPTQYVLGTLATSGPEWINYLHTGKVPA
jgi:hypothetical protein